MQIIYCLQQKTHWTLPVKSAHVYNFSMKGVKIADVTKTFVFHRKLNVVAKRL